MRKLFSALSAACLITVHASSQEKIDLPVIQKIKQEEADHSQVMKIAFNLTDSSGPRLTASPGFMRAANYAKQQLEYWGLVNVMLDPWGEFGTGWQLEKSYVAMKAPYYRPINAFPKAWCGGTNGLKSGDVLLITAKDSAALDAYRGKLAGKILIVDRDLQYHQSFQPDAKRFTNAELDSMGSIATIQSDTAAQRRRREFFARMSPPLSMVSELKKIAKHDGAIALLSMSTFSHDGTLFVQSGGSYKTTDPENFLDIQIGLEDYLTMLRLLKAGVAVKLEADVQTTFYSDDTNGYNVIGEIPGTDPAVKEEVVMLGAHLDSWQGATGATDNGAGSVVMMEAVRILKALNIQPKRTIRIALWSGEEQGLLGSKGYVKKTFGDPKTMEFLPAREKFDVYFNVDNGTGKIRGIYLQGNEECRSIFSKWFEAFGDSSAKTVTLSKTGGTDHQSFDAVGLPGFQFIQDPIEYDTRTHHTTMDSYDHLIADDLKQMAAVVAAFVYTAAQRNDKLPRKDLPKVVPTQ